MSVPEKRAFSLPGGGNVSEIEDKMLVTMPTIEYPYGVDQHGDADEGL